MARVFNACPSECGWLVEHRYRNFVGRGPHGRTSMGTLEWNEHQAEGNMCQKSEVGRKSQGKQKTPAHAPVRMPPHWCLSPIGVITVLLCDSGHLRQLCYVRPFM